MNRIKEFFQILGYYISYPFTQKKDRERDRKLREIAKEDMNSSLTERDIEFLKSIGVNIDCKDTKK